MERYSYDVTPAEYEQMYNERKEREESESREYKAFLETPFGKFLCEESNKNTNCIIQAILRGNENVLQNEEQTQNGLYE